MLDSFLDSRTPLVPGGAAAAIILIEDGGYDLTDILYHRHRETIASPPPDPEVVGQG